MKAANKDILREIKKSGMRFFYICAIIALGVAFFCGIKATSPSMVETAVEYFSQSQLSDFRLLSTYGLREEDIQRLSKVDGVIDADGAYSMDVIMQIGEEEDVIKLMSLPQSGGINAPLLIEGRLPMSNDECVVETDNIHINGAGIGSTITVLDKSLSAEDLSHLKERTFEIVGYIQSPQYISLERGNTNISDGTIDGYAMIRRSAFDYERFTEAYIYTDVSSEGTNPYSDEYSKAQDEMMARLEKTGDEILDDNLYDLRMSALRKINREQRKLDRNKNAFDTQMAEAQKVIDSGQQQLDEGRRQYEEGVNELNTQMANAEAQLDDAQNQINTGFAEYEAQRLNVTSMLLDARNQLAAGRLQYEDGVSQYMTGVEQMNAQLAMARIQMSDARRQLDEGYAQYEEGKRQFDEQSEAGRRELASAEQQYEDGMSQYEAGVNEFNTQIAEAQAQIDDGWRQYEEGLTMYNDNLTMFDQQISQAQAQLNDAETQINQGEAQYQEGLSEYEAGLKEYEQANAAFKEQEAQANQQLEEARQGLAQIDDGINQINANLSPLLDQQAQLQDALTQIASGLQQIDAGLEELNGYAEEIDATLEQLDQALQMDPDNPELLAQKQQLEAQKEQINAQITQAQTQKEQLEGQREQANSGLAQLAEPIAQLEAQLEQLTDQRNQIQEQITLGETQLEEGRKQLEEAKAQLDAADQMLKDSRVQLDQAKEDLEKGKAEFNAQREQGLAALEEAKDTLDSSYEQLEAGEQELARQAQAGREQLQSAYTQLQQARAMIDSGYKQLADGERQLNEALATLVEGQAQLRAGEEQLETQAAAGEAQLSEAKAALDQAGAQIQAGEAELNANEQMANTQLAQGLEQLQTAQTQLQQGRVQMAEQRTAAEAQLSQAKETIDSSQQQLDEGKAELEKNRAEGQQQIDDGQKQIDDAKKEVDDLERGTWYVYSRDDNPGYTGYQEDAERIDNVANVFPLFFFLVAALVAFSTMTRMVEEERTQIGTLYALGYSKWQIIKKYVIYAGAAALIGATIGWIFGVFLLPWLIFTAYNILYDMPDMVLKIPWHIVVISYVVSLLCTVGAAAFIALSELRSVPAELMRPKAPKPGKRILLERITPIWNRLGFITKVSARNIFRYKARLMMTVLGIAGCTALLLAGFGLHDAIFTIVPSQFGSIFKYDQSLILDDDSEADITAKLSKVLEDERIEGAMAVDQKSINVVTDNGVVSAYLIIPRNPADLENFIGLHERANPDERIPLTDSGVVVSEKLATNYNAEPGNNITLEIENDRYTAEVAAQTENYLRNYVYMTPELYEEVTGQKPDYSVIFVNFKDTVTSAEDQDAFASDILANEGFTSAINTQTMVDTAQKTMDSLNVIVLVMIVSAGILAFIVLNNLTNINISERIREIATLKVLGFRQSETNNYIFRENLVLSIFGIALGLLLGILLLRFIIVTVELDIIMFGREIHTMSYVYSILMTLGFTIIVNLTMIPVMKRVNMVEALKDID